MAEDTLERRHRFVVMPEALVLDARVSDRAVRLWALLDRIAGAKPSSFPSRRYLADRMGCSWSTIDRALGELIDAGWVTRESRKSEGKSSRYTLDDASDSADRRGGASPVGHPTSDAGGASPMTQGCVTSDAHKEELPKEELPKEESVPADAGTSRDLNAGRDDVDRICTHLSQRLTERDVKHNPATKAWRDAARLLLDTDGRTEDQVHTAIEWCQRHHFWHRQILSMPTLREKYDRLRLDAQAEVTGGGNVTRLPVSHPDRARLGGYFDQTQGGAQ